jgi:hypothetical protein
VELSMQVVTSHPADVLISPQLTNITGDPNLSRRNFYKGICDGEEVCNQITVKNLKVNRNATTSYDSQLVFLVTDRRPFYLRDLTPIEVKATIVETYEGMEILGISSFLDPIEVLRDENEVSSIARAISASMIINIVTSAILLLAILVILFRYICGFMRQ